MTEHIDIETEPKVISEYADLFEVSEAFSPGRVLDTEVDVLTGDSILTSAAQASYDDNSVVALIDRWSRFSETPVENNTQKSQVAVAHKKVLELSLIRTMYSQLAGEDDGSVSIEALEAKIYDHYSEEMYRTALQTKIGLIKKIELLDPALEVARADLLDTLEPLAATKGSEGELLESPEVETLKAVGDWLKTRFGDSLRLVDSLDKESLDAHDIVSLMNQVIQLEPALRDSGWKSKEIVRSKAAISVYAPEKSILVSSTRKITAKDMQNLIMQKLIIHEPFGHALRSANAERNGNEVGQFGTATYSTFEESFEIALEQCFIGKHDPSRGLDYYIAAGLTVSDKMPAQEISRILESMHQLKKATSPLTEKAVSAAQRMTGMQLKRTFSGMTDVDAGIAHLKDINYLHGLNGTWKLLNYLVKTDTLDNGMEWLLSAKFNPYDADDRQLMSEFSPMPDSLISFFDAEQKDINDYAK